MLRVLDILIAVAGLVILSPLVLLILIAGLFDTGKPVFLQPRVGRHQARFTLIKFRTMAINTESVGTHLVQPNAITSLGRFLRRTKLDELPQLLNVLVGQMSIVGPRPCLPSQYELIAERAEREVFTARPGITGLAQVLSIDMSTPKLLADTDAEMLASLNFYNYVKYILQTLTGRGLGDRVRPQS